MSPYFKTLILLLVSILSFAQVENDCSRKIHFGKVEICLPEIEGFKECYSDLLVKQLADKTVVPENQALGYYLESFF